LLLLRLKVVIAVALAILRRTVEGGATYVEDAQQVAL
jgi:hypothetical protein